MNEPDLPYHVHANVQCSRCDQMVLGWFARHGNQLIPIGFIFPIGHDAKANTPFSLRFAEHEVVLCELCYSGAPRKAEPKIIIPEAM